MRLPFRKLESTATMWSGVAKPQNIDKESLISSEMSKKETLSELSILRILCILLTLATAMLVGLALTLFIWTSIEGK